MERGVRQGSKEGPLLFNNTFQPEEICNLTAQMGITPVAKNGVEWKFGHIEYADDLCLIASTIAEAEGLLQRLDIVLANFHMEIATDKTQWMCLGEEPERNLLHFGSKSIERVHSYRYLGSPINTLGDATEAVSGGISNGRRQLMKIGPILCSSVLAVQTSYLWAQLKEDTQNRGAGEESAPEMPNCYNTAKASEPMDWAEQTEAEPSEKADRKLPERQRWQKEGSYQVLESSASS
ncbi:unnamed protein product [Hymenolepis diminuta]|uniref:Reverse transcriptase domain-containing protein n=1 Tax=Hymenolepis diminuta TaxID=6216 RepID=A0A564YJA3_HYMDI|nr:unnamed protein product [Hymenolepis diminuta]